MCFIAHNLSVDCNSFQLFFKAMTTINVDHHNFWRPFCYNSGLWQYYNVLATITNFLVTPLFRTASVEYLHGIVRTKVYKTYVS